MAISALPVLMYLKVHCAPVLETTIFAPVCRFLIQLLKPFNGGLKSIFRQCHQCVGTGLNAR
jgi:hypothetical protein